MRDSDQTDFIEEHIGTWRSCLQDCGEMCSSDIAGLEEQLIPPPEKSETLRNISLLIFPMLAGYFAWKRRIAPAAIAFLAGIYLLGALLADVFALWAIAARITEFGFSPNRTAALGVNLLLLVNLAWSAALYISFMRGRSSFSLLERWQTGYVPVYAAWAAAVVIVFPPLFGFM